VIAFSKADGIEATLNGNDGGNIRYARNSVSTSGEDSNVSLGVQSYFGKKSREQPPSMSLTMPPWKKVVETFGRTRTTRSRNSGVHGATSSANLLESKTFIEATANITPDYRAQAAANSINPAAAKDVTAAGYLTDNHGFSALMNSKGLFAYNKSQALISRYDAHQ